ncbi:protein of unknown function [Ectopseudomonas oleovorans]|nr:protein of unknown function [Pseudomonas oleovorans]
MMNLASLIDKACYTSTPGRSYDLRPWRPPFGRRYATLKIIPDDFLSIGACSWEGNRRMAFFRRCVRARLCSWADTIKALPREISYERLSSKPQASRPAAIRILNRDAEAAAGRNRSCR